MFSDSTRFQLRHDNSRAFRLQWPEEFPRQELSAVPFPTNSGGRERAVRLCEDVEAGARPLEFKMRFHRFGGSELGSIGVGALACLCLSLAAAGSPVDVRALADAVDAHYNRLQSMQTNFTEIYQGAGMDRTESGTLWLKKPGKMRWEYRSPREKLFVSDGKTVWFYVPADRQARKEPAKKLEDLRSPLAFLLGKTKLEKELRGLSLAPDVNPREAGDVVLRGMPQAIADQVSEVLLEITPEHEIRQITLQDVDGSTTEYRFSDQKSDVAVDSARFEFRPPAGTEVVEGLEP
jgi:outer membrane lipoprotein carrier protein